MNTEQRQYLVALGLAPAIQPPVRGPVRAVNENGLPILDQEPVPWPTEGDLGRMLTWRDLEEDGYHLQKFQSGRSFKLRSKYENALVDFYERIFLAYPEELRSGVVAYDPNVHNQRTNLYEGQLNFLKRMIAEEN